MVACVNLEPKDEGLGSADPAGAGGTPPAVGAGGTGGTEDEEGGAAGQAGDDATVDAGSGGVGTGATGSIGGDAGVGGECMGICGGSSGNGEGPCNAGGHGGECVGERDPTCVSDCSSLERTPAILDAEGSWRCPDDAPMRAEECHIDCTALYDGWENGDSEYGDPYVCGAGTFCAARGLASYNEPCTGPLGTDCRCTVIPAECPADTDLTRPTCGANGESYANRCEMWQSRMSFPGESSLCADDRSDHYLCQTIYCREGLELCEGPHVVDDNSVTWGRCTESACVASGGCACLVAELGEEPSPDAESPGPVPYGYVWCSDEIEGRIVLR